jgi:(R,R)-butanediol dehydrogenase/meso-butanediol dehydrogenase/diacetyl reductase/L-iditol 2-dehydrogenase
VDAVDRVDDLEDAPQAFETHLSGEFPKVVIRCNDLDDEVGRS